jgi:hypothetical protein
MPTMQEIGDAIPKAIITSDYKFPSVVSNVTDAGQSSSPSLSSSSGSKAAFVEADNSISKVVVADLYRFPAAESRAGAFAVAAEPMLSPRSVAHPLGSIIEGDEEMNSDDIAQSTSSSSNEKGYRGSEITEEVVAAIHEALPKVVEDPYFTFPPLRPTLDLRNPVATILEEEEEEEEEEELDQGVAEPVLAHSMEMIMEDNEEREGGSLSVYRGVTHAHELGTSQSVDIIMEEDEEEEVSEQLSSSETTSSHLEQSIGSLEVLHEGYDQMMGIEILQAESVEPDAMNLVEPARRFDDSIRSYQLIKTVGTGSFGRVHLAVHRPNSTHVALKVLRKADVVRLRQVEHTLDERRIMGRMNCPFLVKLLCAFQDPGHLYFVMEYIQGGELFSFLRREEVCIPCYFFLLKIAPLLIFNFL